MSILRGTHLAWAWAWKKFDDWGEALKAEDGYGPEGAYKRTNDLPDGDNRFSDEELAQMIDDATGFSRMADEAVKRAKPMDSIVGPDPSTGGAPQTDPDQEAIAAAETAEAEPEPPAEEMEVTANRTQPTLRGFTDQTFLLMHLANLTRARNEPLDPELLDKASDDPFTQSTLRALKAPLPYAYLPTQAPNNFDTNAAIQCYGDPYSFLNYLTAWPGYLDYLNSSTEKLSQAASQIRIFKVFQEDKREEAVEIVFPTDGISGAEVEELMRNGSKRGYGAGIKEFTITLDGTNPITRTRMISATLVIYADSMDTLLKPRFGNRVSKSFDTSNLNYRYADLALRSDTVPGNNGPKDTDASFGMIDDLDYKLVFEVGLTKDPSTNAMMAGFTSMSCSLQPIIHSYQIGQDGSITLSIDYKGFIEKEYSNPIVYDVFSTQDSVAKDLAMQLGAYYLNKTCGPKATKSFNENMLNKGNADLKTRVASLMTSMRTEGKIYYIKIDEEVVHAYNTAFNSYEKKMKAATTDANTGNKKENLGPSDKKMVEDAFKKLQQALQKIVEEADEDDSLELSVIGSANLDKEVEKIEKAAEEEETDEEEDSGNVLRCAVNPNNIQVSYFYAGDLINLILRNISLVYSPESAQISCDRAMEILKADPVYGEVVGAVESVMDPGGRAQTIMESIEANPWGLTGELKKQMVDDEIDELFEAVDDIQNKYADTLIGMEEVKRKFAARGDRFKKLRVVLGPTMIKDFFTEKPYMCSIGDLPIPLNHFNSWLAQEVEGKDKHRIGLNDFLDKFINQYLRGYLMGDPKMDGGTLGQKKSYTSAPLVAYNPSHLVENDILTSLRRKSKSRRGLAYEEVSQSLRPILDTSGNRMRASSVKKAYDYLVFHEKHASPVFNMKPDHANLNRNAFLSYFGVSMFQHGRDRGILKTAEYQTTNIQGLKEARYQAGKLNGLAQLAEVFDVTLNCYADLQMYPGHRLYLDPKSLVPFLSKETLASLGGYSLEDFGVGGFYVVNSVQHSFAQGKFDTTIKAQWEQWQKNKPKKKTESEEKYNEYTQRLNEPIKDACKGNEGPGGLEEMMGELYQEAESWARSVFGDEITDMLVGYGKGLSDIATSFFEGDNGSKEATESQWGSAAEYAADQTSTNVFPDVSNPDSPGTGESAFNGPRNAD